MKKAYVKNWKVVLLLSMVVPIGLLTAFKVTGVLREPTTPTTVSQTTTLETVESEVERPATNTDIDYEIETSCAREGLSTVQNILVDSYRGDYVSITINVTATIQKGHIESLYVSFHEDYQLSQVYMPSPELTPVFYESLRNLSIIDWACAFDRWWLLENDTKAFIKAAGENNPNIVYFWAPAHWILRSPNNYTHQMQIICEITYFNGSAYKKVVQPYHLNIGPDDNDDFDTADTINTGTVHSKLYIGSNDWKDYYRFHADAQFIIDVWAEAPSSDPHPNFYVNLYDPCRTRKAGSNGYGRSHSFTFTADSTGDWFIEVRRHDTFGFYSLLVWVHTPSCGGCPYISVWNGTQYAIDNNLLAESEHSNGADVMDYYRLEQTSVPRFEGGSFSLHSLMISEFENEHSYLDYVQLLAVDYSSEVDVAVSPHGDILTYTNPYAPVSAVDDKGENVAHLINSVGGGYYEGCNGSYVVLDFGDLDIGEDAKLVIRTDYPKVVAESIHIQIQDSEGAWKTIETIVPRVNWATEIIDMSEYLSLAGDNLEVRLYLTANHKIDYVGLDTSPQAIIHVKIGSLILAKHSVSGFVTSLLCCSDNVYAELFPGQNIKLFFTLPKQTAEFRTYIVIAEGRYETITM